MVNTLNKILIVDDDSINRDFFNLMLSKLGFVVEEAGDGLEALAKLKKFFPDLIILDNIMPKMSGWELTKNLKTDPKYRDIPIIMFSALDDVKDKLAGFELGIDDYITKPFNFSEVLARIKNVLRNKELFTQVAVYETRFGLAEELNRDMKQNLSDFVKSLDDLDSAVKLLKPAAEIIDKVQEKTKNIRRHIAELDARLDKAILEWEDIKKNETGLSTLDTEIRKFLNQE